MSDSTPATQSPVTVVLVHGAFADSSGWYGVIDELRARGHATVAAANPLRSLSGDSDYLASILAGIPGPIVLVGHSYGGLVTSNAAKGNPNVKALVYVASFLPEAGENAFDLSGRFPGSTLGPTLVQFPLPGGGNDLYIRSDAFWQQFAADVPEAQATLMASTQRPIVDAALTDPAGDPAWKEIPSWSVYGELDRNIPAASMAFMAERAGSRQTVVLPGASHVPMISQPKAVAGVILSAIEATSMQPAGA